MPQTGAKDRNPMPDRVGVQLAADDAANYFKTLDRVNKATAALIGGAQSAVDALNDLDSAERKAGKGAKGLGDDVDTSTKQISLFDKVVTGAAERVGHLAVNALADAGRAVLNFAKDGVKAAGDFEGGMQNFEAVIGDSLAGSGQTVEQFRDLFISLGRDLPVSTMEVQQAAIEMAKGGIEPATIAAGGLEQTLKFAAAANLGLAESATIAAKVVGGWARVGASAEEKARLLTHATDLLAKAANASTVDVDELAMGLYNAQGAARNAGVSLDETVKTLAAVSSSFASSSEAGNSFKNFMARLQPQTAPASKAMAELGLLTREGTSAFYDAGGGFIGMAKASDLLNKATKNLTAADKSRLLQLAFGNDAQGVAVKLAELGADGYDDMTASIAKQLGVADQAAKKQQGWNVALDNLSGSIEALQITVFSRALPALTRLVGVFASGINAITDYAAATAEGQTALSGIIAFIGDAALPALYGLTAALAAYAVVQTIQATPAILASLPAIAAQTAAFVANAAAIAAAMAPYAAIAVAVAGVAYAYQGLQEQLANVTDKVLASSPAWQAGVQALDAYDAASKEVQTAAAGQAEGLRALQTEQRGAIEQYALHVAAYEEFGVASGQTAESLEKERLAINTRGDAIIQGTAALNNQIAATEAEQQAILNAEAAAITATSVTENLTVATAGLGGQAALTEEDIAKLTEKIRDITVQGGAALQSYASTYSTFFSGVEQRQADHAAKIEELEGKKRKATTAEQKAAIDEQIAQANQAYADQETAAAESYVRQQEEQRKHLGQLLLDYTVAQATLATTDEGRRDRLLAVAQAVEKEYGLQESSTASTFLAMTRSIDTFSKDSGQSIDSLIGKLRDQETQAKDTQKAEDAYYHDSAAAAAATFAEKGGDVQTYIDTLNKIPTDVESIMSLPDIEDREQEIRDINRGLLQLPKDVRIRIRVQDEVPPEYKPGSPTPFEIGIRGITKAVDELGQAGIILPGLTQEVGDIAGGLGELITQSDLPDDAADLGDDIMDGWRDSMRDGFDDLNDLVDDMSEELKKKMEESWDTHSPSGVTEELGENIMLGLLNSLDTMLPDLLNVIQQITATMGAGMGGLTDELRQQLEDQLETIADVAGELPDLINEALADALGSTADFLRQQGDNLRAVFDIGRDPGDAAGAAERIAALDKQLAERRARLSDIRAARVIVSPEERAKLEREIADLSAQRAEHAKEQAKAAQQQQQRLALQKRTQDAIAKATADASAMDDPTKAAAFLSLRSQQILRLADLERQRLETTDPKQRSLIDAQIALEKKAQEAELQAFELQKDQLGATQDLIDALTTLNDNLTISGDMPPEIMALFTLLTQLIGASTRASGGTMAAMRPYLVGERGPELVIPDQNSQILSALDTRRALAPEGASGGNSTIYGGTTIVNVDARGSNLSEAQITRAVWSGIDQASANADVRVRMGVG